MPENTHFTIEVFKKTAPEMDIVFFGKKNMDVVNAMNNNKYLLLLDTRKTFKEISLYSSGKNRNKAMLAMKVYFLDLATFTESIKITYLLSGHTMMPFDSVHRTIE